MLSTRLHLHRCCFGHARSVRTSSVAEIIIAGLKRELKLKDDIIAAAIADKAAAIADKDAFIAVKDVVTTLQTTANAKTIAHLTHKVDVANGIIDFRSVLETAIETLWIMARCGNHVAASKTSTSAMLLDVMDEKHCPGLAHYLAVAATDNGITVKSVHTQAKRICSKSSMRLHTVGATGTGAVSAVVPSDVSKGTGKATLVAMAAFVSFTGRALMLYDFDPELGPKTPRQGVCILLRVPPITGCRATLAEITAQPLIEHKKLL